MGLFEKLKNTFFEEEYVEVDEKEEAPKKEEKKEKNRVVDMNSIDTDEVRNRTKVEEVEEIDELDELNNLAEEAETATTISDRELVNKNNKIEYFNDDDFVTKDYYKEEKVEPKKIYGGEYTNTTLYNANNDKKIYNKPYGASNDKGFQPTPIISPIYGVLDKNYHKDEVIDKKDRPSSYVSKKNADLDSVRQKAYGFSNMNELPSYDEIMNDTEVEETKDGLLDDIVEESNKPVVDKVSIADAEQYFEDLGLEYNVDYKDAVYEKANGRRTAIHEYDDEKTQEIILNDSLTKEEKVESEPEESNLLEDNLFDLVDSMYEDGDDE